MVEIILKYNQKIGVKISIQYDEQRIEHMIK